MEPGSSGRTHRWARPTESDVRVEATALEVQRAMLVARMMGAAPTWVSSSEATPGWWLDSWARRLADDVLGSVLRPQVLTWLDGTRAALHDADDHALHDVSDHDALRTRRRRTTAARVASDEAREAWRGDWVAGARALVQEGVELEARVVAELGGAPAQ